MKQYWNLNKDTARVGKIILEELQRGYGPWFDIGLGLDVFFSVVNGISDAQWLFVVQYYTPKYNLEINALVDVRHHNTDLYTGVREWKDKLEQYMIRWPAIANPYQ